MLSREGSKLHHIAVPMDLGNEVAYAAVVARFQIVYFKHGWKGQNSEPCCSGTTELCTTWL
jgi:hypothetical protein